MLTLFHLYAIERQKRYHRTELVGSIRSKSLYYNHLCVL